MYWICDPCNDGRVARRASKFPVLRSKWPRIVDYRKTSLVAFMVDGRYRGSGRREYIKDLTDAKLRAEQLATQRQNQGTAALSFTARETVMAAECSVRLKPFRKTLRDATDFLIAHLERETANFKSPAICVAVAEYLAQRERDVARGDLSEESLKDLRQVTKNLTAHAGHADISAFGPERLRAFLDSFPVSARTRYNIRVRISSLFTFAKRKGWIAANPCADVSVKVRRHEIVILSVEEVEQLLRCAEASKHRDVLVPYVCLCVFASLRPFECQRLDWRQIDFETNHIHVLAHTSKRRESRYVQIEPTLREWLIPYAKASGPIIGRNFRKQFESLLRVAGYGPKRRWVADVLRHTGASMLLAIKRNKALVAEELGTSVQVLRKNYIVPILPATAMRFWALSPRVAPESVRGIDSTAQA